MSPGTRRGRGTGGFEEARLRDLSPGTTLRAFVEKPMPYDTSRDEYKIFACIESLTPAERDLGARVAKAAERLKSWCKEIEQWGWSGGFEAPSEVHREERRKSLELHIREHVGESAMVEHVGPLQYWGSLLSVEVESHDARLDEIGDELLALDVEELKEHVLDIHGHSRSRPSSAGFEASRHHYTPMDDFSFLITQTLLSALPQHWQLKDQLGTWTARVSILREAPRYLDDLKVAQKAMRLGWEAIEPPTDQSDVAFEKWKEAVETISSVLREKVSHLGQCLDKMLDNLEGRDDRLPEEWIDVFEGVEADFSRWAHESRKSVIAFGVRRKAGHNDKASGDLSDGSVAHSKQDDTKIVQQASLQRNPAPVQESRLNLEDQARDRSVTAFHPAPYVAPSLQVDLITSAQPSDVPEPESPGTDDDVFEEGETIVHHELEQLGDGFSSSNVVNTNVRSQEHIDSPIVTIEEPHSTDLPPDQPHTPRLRSGSIDSLSSDISISSSPPSALEESPSMRNKTSRSVRAPKPELNAVMRKSRPATNSNTLQVDNPPWPPTQFSKELKGDALDRQISAILTTIPAHIRLTSREAAEEAKLARRGMTKRGSKGYLRATRSMTGLKTPELTLSPAKPDDTAHAALGRKSAAAMRGDNEIRMYHLTQPGKEIPQKLYIRRVGENGERVMVRVGGGWADLGEYLRQYAEHHGRRTASNGNFEILGLQVNRSESPRPDSAMSKPDRRFSGGHYKSPVTTPKKVAGLGILESEAAPPVPSLKGTPLAVDGDVAAPSTASSQHSWAGSEVGLAGPKAKKMDLSGEKLDWIEGMMKQAKRTVSSNFITIQSDSTPATQGEGSESRNDSGLGRRKSDFGDLGKVGGTKRVFLKQSGLGEQ
jgi:hypothetical protein